MAKAKPNLGWLEAARQRLNENPGYRRLGNADLTLALHIGDEARLVPFEAFEIGPVSALDPADLRDADLVIQMSARDWNAYLRKRRTGSGPSLLTLDLEQGVVGARNPLKRLLLERYFSSIQMFIDTGAQLAA